MPCVLNEYDSETSSSYPSIQDAYGFHVDLIEL